MSDLKIGQKIELSDGSYVNVVKKLGEGGQGAVYSVKSNSGETYALKWYISQGIIYNQDFYRNLDYNIRLGSPAPSFIWPLKLAIRQLGSYGYIMDLRPSNYIEFGKFFKSSFFKDAKFSSRQAQIHAALCIVDGFRHLHIKGFSYKDINDGNFFINPKTGNVLICDNDNVTANNIEGLIGGKARYMAAEVVNGSRPNINSDFFSLAIILYRIFMIDHPMEGKRTLQPCLTDEIQKKVYGNDMVFCWDVDLDVNRPDKINHKNSIYNWSHSPLSLRQIFTKALSRRAVLYPEQRVRDIEWKNYLLKLRANSICCPSGLHDILSDESIDKCPRCQCSIDMHRIPRIEFKDFSYAITDKKIFYLNDSLIPYGLGVVYKGKNGPEIGLKNLSGVTWSLETASGNILQIKNGDCFPLRNGMQIVFNGVTRCRIVMK